MGKIVGAVLNAGPDLIRAVAGLFDESDESAEEPGDLANLGAVAGRIAARFIPDASEDKVGELMMAVGEAGEFLKAAGRALKQANEPETEG